MGFEEEQATKALKKYPDSLDQAVEFLSKLKDINEAQSKPKPRVAKSLVCTDTGKTFRTLEAAQAYAQRTGNSNFEERDVEIPPMSEEEKQKKIADLKERLKQKREQKKNDEKVAKIVREKMRREGGQKDGEMREKMLKQQRLNQIELMKKEKREDEELRQKLREDIAKDKGNRAAEKAQKEGKDGNEAYKKAYSEYMSKANPTKKEKTPEERLDQVVSAISVLDSKVSVLKTLLKMTTNIRDKPTEEKFRKVKVGNAAFHKRVGRYRSGIVYFSVIGFLTVEENGEKILSLTEENTNIELLNKAIEKLSAALAV